MEAQSQEDWLRRPAKNSMCNCTALELGIEKRPMFIDQLMLNMPSIGKCGSSPGNGQ